MATQAKKKDEKKDVKKHDPTPIEASPKKKTFTNAEIAQRTILYTGIIIVLPFVVQFLGNYLVALFSVIGLQSEVGFIQANTWTTDVISYALLYWLMLFYLRTTFNPLSYYGYVWKRAYILIAIALGIVSGGIIYWMDTWGGIANLGVEPFTMVVGIGYLFGWVLLPAIFEETLFRGVFQTFYSDAVPGTVTRWNIPKAVFIASGFEVGFHLFFPVFYHAFSGGGINPQLGSIIIGTLPQLAYVAVFGAIGGYLFARTGSLLAPIIIHAVGNLTELILIWRF